MVFPLVPALAGAFGVNKILGGDDSGSAASPQQTEADRARKRLQSEFGGVPGGAAYESQRQARQGDVYRGQGQQAQGRQGVQIATGQTYADYAQQQQARGGQSRLAQAMEQRAAGQVPSIASQEAARQQQQMAAQQASAAASARGPAGLAMAQQNAAANTAAASGNIAGQAAIAAAQERLAAEQAASGAYGQIRGQDLGAMGQSAQQAQAQAQFEAQQRAQNDQFQLGLGGLGLGHDQAGIGVSTAQMQNYTQREAGERDAWKAQMEIDQAAKRSQEGNIWKIVDKFTGSDERMKQGVVMLPDASGPGAEEDDKMKGLLPVLVKAFGGAGAAGGAAMLSDMAAKNVGLNGLVGLGNIGGLALSDARAKRDAFDAGVEFGGLTRALKAPGPMETQALMERNDNFNTPLSADEEKQFQAWKKKYASWDQGTDYDLRGAFKAGLKPDPQSGHWPDTYKKPNHETFSDESQYASAAPNWAGHWSYGKGNEETYTPGPGGAPGGDPMARALSTLRPYEYEYKPGFGQEPGRQVGPMAQDMTRDPIAAQTIKQDPATGMLAIDKERALKLSLAGAGYLNNKVQQQQQQLDALSRAMGQPSDMEQMAKRTRGK